MFRLLAGSGAWDAVCLALGVGCDEGAQGQPLRRAEAAVYSKRVAAAYVIVACVLLQLFNNLHSILKLGRDCYYSGQAPAARCHTD